jgi:hypothetical protein
MPMRAPLPTTMPWSSRRFDVPCTVKVSHTFDDLSAHVELEGDLPIHAGDKVLVHGAPIAPPFGAVQVEKRMATVTRAPWLLRAFTRLTGDLDCLSLLDVSFTDRRTL